MLRAWDEFRSLIQHMDYHDNTEKLVMTEVEVDTLQDNFFLQKHNIFAKQLRQCKVRYRYLNGGQIDYLNWENII